MKFRKSFTLLSSTVVLAGFGSSLSFNANSNPIAQASTTSTLNYQKGYCPKPFYHTFGMLSEPLSSDKSNAQYERYYILFDRKSSKLEFNPIYYKKDGSPILDKKGYFQSYGNGFDFKLKYTAYAGGNDYYISDSANKNNLYLANINLKNMVVHLKALRYDGKAQNATNIKYKLYKTEKAIDKAANN